MLALLFFELISKFPLKRWSLGKENVLVLVQSGIYWYTLRELLTGNPTDSINQKQWGIHHIKEIMACWGERGREKTHICPFLFVFDVAENTHTLCFIRMWVKEMIYESDIDLRYP